MAVQRRFEAQAPLQIQPAPALDLPPLAVEPGPAVVAGPEAVELGPAVAELGVAPQPEAPPALPALPD